MRERLRRELLVLLLLLLLQLWGGGFVAEHRSGSILCEVRIGLQLLVTGCDAAAASVAAAAVPNAAVSAHDRAIEELADVVVEEGSPDLRNGDAAFCTSVERLEASVVAVGHWAGGGAEELIHRSLCPAQRAHLWPMHQLIHPEN